MPASLGRKRPRGLRPLLTLPAAARRLLRELALSGTHLGLEHFRRLLQALGDPHLGLPVVLVAGTNGKGSTAAFLAAMASASGYRTGLYTSPHLEEVEERIRIDGGAIGGERLVELLSEVIAAAGEEQPTYFEALTAAAFLHFHRSKVDLAVLEVGLGGRLDATNVSKPVLSVITDISLDHQQYLGGTLQEIAIEKAGVLRTGGPAVIGVVPPTAHRAIAAHGGAIGSRLVWSEEEVQALTNAPGAQGEQRRVIVQTRRWRHRLRSKLAGDHQLRNLAVALLAAEELAALGWNRIESRTIERAVSATSWPGRLERVVGPNGEQVLLDVAHNPGGVEALVRFLGREPSPYVILFGALRDKDVGSMLPLLAAKAERVVLTRPTGERGWEPADLMALGASQGAEKVVVERRIAVALDRGLEELKVYPQACLVVCGSTFVVGPVRRLLRRRWGRPASPLDLWPAVEGLRRG